MTRACCLIAALLAVAAGAGCRGSGDTPGVVVLPGMVESVPFNAYDPNPLTPTGQTLLVPPEGTIPVEGPAPFPYAPTTEDAERAGRELENPVAATPAALARGAHVYDTFCAVCHGAGGDGDGPVIGRFPNPPSYHTPRARAMGDGQLYHIITLGQGKLMASYAAQVRPDDRWKVIHHVRRLQAERQAAQTAAAAGGEGGRP